MNRFVKNVLIFMLPIFISGGCVEILIRNIPNDYSYKKSYLDKNSKNIEVLFLGSSHAYYDINPIYIHANSFNAGYVSQTLNYDFEILKKYNGRWDQLDYIVISISYFSLYSKLEETTEAWRTKNYTIYYNINKLDDISSYFEIFGNKPEVNINRIKSYYFLEEENITTSELGWGTNFNSQQGFTEDGKATAERHRKFASANFINENLNILNAFIKYAEKEDVNIVFYTPPAFHTYIENLDQKQLRQTIVIMTQLDDKYQNVVYHNFLTDNSFVESDFFNTDHLNEIGAEKFTKKIDSLLIDTK